MEELQSIINQIAIQVDKRGGKMFYVGGYVRDLHLGKEPSDIDVRVIGISKEDFCAILEQFGKICCIDARIDLIKLIGFDIDFLSPENKDGSLRTTEDLTQDVDFTMNSIFMDVITGEIYDPFNGREDIENGIIRIANKDEITDEFLAIRACRFKAKLSFEIEEESKEMIKAFDFKNVSRQRILPELRKVLNNPEVNQAEFYKTALELGVLGKLFAPLDRLAGLSVDYKGKKVDAFEHTTKMLSNLIRYKDRIEDFEEFYMICLTYHLRTISKDSGADEFRTFFQNIIATNKMKATVNFFKDDEDRLFMIYNSFKGMPTEKFLMFYSKFRRRLEFSGYVAESFKIAAEENLTQEEMIESEHRLNEWEKKILEARELSIKSLKKPKTRRKRKLKKTTVKTFEEYSFEEVRRLTQGITSRDIKREFSSTLAKRRGRDGRYR